jgi:hypothetical protein
LHNNNMCILVNVNKICYECMKCDLKQVTN